MKKLERWLFWSLVFAVCIFAFWVIWFEYTRAIPVVTHISFAGGGWQLPFEVSRLWDMLLGPVLAVIWVIWKSPGVDKIDWRSSSIVVALSAGVVDWVLLAALGCDPWWGGIIFPFIFLHVLRCFSLKTYVHYWIEISAVIGFLFGLVYFPFIFLMGLLFSAPGVLAKELVNRFFPVESTETAEE